MVTLNSQARYPRISAGLKHFTRLKIAEISLKYSVSNRDAATMIETALNDPTVIDRILLSLQEQADTVYRCGAPS